MRVEAFGRHQMRSNATTVSSHHKLMFWMQKWDFLLMKSHEMRKEQALKHKIYILDMDKLTLTIKVTEIYE